MSFVTTATSSLSPAPTRKKLELAFLTNGSFSDQAPGGAAQGHKEVIELFRIAEELGYDTGWVRNRHFDNYLSSPLTALAAASQKTSRIKLGTAIIPVGYEHPIRLAEDAATVDLLSDQRLELGIAGGPGMFQSIFFGDNDGPWDEASQRRVGDFLNALRRKSLGTSSAGDDYHVRPHSKGLINRVWYGPSTVEKAVRTAKQGMDLLLSTIGPKMELSFEEAQLAQIRAHSAAWERSDRGPRVSTSRLFFPALNDRQRKLYQKFADLRASDGATAPRPVGSLQPLEWTRPGRPEIGLMSPVFVGEPAEVVDYLRNDVAVAESGELMIFLPPNFNHAENVELLENVAEHVACDLGWAPQRN